MIKKKKYYGTVLLALLLGIGSLSVPLSAATTNDAEDKTPAFSNPAQAERAANLSKQAAISNDSVQEVLQDVEDAEKALDKTLTKSPDDAKAIAEVRETLAKAEEARAKQLADISGVSATDIASMRDLGMGWGQICHELGIHPSANGLGHTVVAEPTISRVSNQELTEATAKNLQSGWSKGHGVGVRSGVHDPGTGLFDGTTMGYHARGHNKDRGISGAGGLGHGGGPDGSMDGSGVGGGRGNSGGNKGGKAGSKGGPGNSGDRGKSGSSNGKSGKSHGNSGGKTP